MSNRIIMGVLIVVVLVVAGAGFTWFRNSTSNTEPTSSQAPQTEAESEVQADTGGGPMSLKDLWASTVSQKCTFSDPESKSSGTVYVAQKKMRGDFTTSTQSQSLASHMISDGQTAYMWTEGSAQGMKISMDKFISPSAAPATGSAQSNNNVDVNRKVDYKCEGWNVDSSMFQVPTNVQFSDLGAMMPQVMSSAGAGINPQAACEACNRLSGAAKEQCETALSC